MPRPGRFRIEAVSVASAPTADSPVDAGGHAGADVGRGVEEPLQGDPSRTAVIRRTSMLISAGVSGPTSLISTACCRCVARVARLSV